MRPIEYYTDYRIFLKDRFEALKKKHDNGYSYRVFNKTAGIASPSLFLEVVKGKRGLSKKTLPKFIKGLTLTEREARYFTVLVSFNQAGDMAEKQRWLEALRGLRKMVSPRVVPSDQYEFYAKWYNPVLRELACLMDWKGSYLRLAKAVNPPVSAKEARAAVKLMLKLNLLKKGKDGKFSQTNPAITTGPEVMSLAVRRLNREFSEMGVKAIDRIRPEDRDISSMTIGVSREAVKALKDEIVSFRDKVRQIVDEDKASDMVYNLNVQLFPMSQLTGKEG